MKVMEAQYHGPIPRFELVAQLRSMGLPENVIELEIEQMKIVGDIYEPRSGFVQKL